MNASIVVAGSLNMDFVVSTERLPALGETVLGRNFQMIPGGKGANQACAAGKLAGPGTSVKMVGRVGCDVFADHLKASLSAAGVDVSAVTAAGTEATGVALIWIDRSGQNSIVVASGANRELSPADVGPMRTVFRGAKFVLFQLETPLDTVRAALAAAREEGAKTILDPAPAQPLSRDFFRLADIITPNETEALILLGRPPGRVSLEDAPGLASALRNEGAGVVILKMGEQGCFFDDGSRQIRVPGFPVSVRDTTAAGDTFNAALAVALSEGKSVEDALRFANAAAAISVTRLGAQASVPVRAEVEGFLSSAART